MSPDHHRIAPGAAAGFAVLALAAIAGFWPPYLSQLTAMPTLWLHLHAASVAAWLLLLVLQPLLVAGRQRALHRRLGRTAWVLAPVVVVTSAGLAVVMTQPRDSAGIEEFRYALFFVQMASTALWALSAGLALAWRHDPALHARLMLCSGLLFIDPVVARVFGHWTPQAPLLVAHGSVVLSVAAFGLLAWVDRRAPRGRRVFAGFGALNLAMHGAALGIDHWPPWRAAMQAWLG